VWTLTIFVRCCSLAAASLRGLIGLEIELNQHCVLLRKGVLTGQK
jgi:hypothetical protein